MPWGSRHSWGSEAGSALIEVMVSAAIFVAIALATLSAIDQTQKTSLNGKIRSVAATLADQDQERLRGMKATVLSAMGTTTRTVQVDDVNYTVTSSAQWIRDDVGVPEGCTEGNGVSASYIKITSTATDPTGNALNRPVSVSSFVTPPTAVYGPNQGTLAVKVLDRDGAPLQGITVTTSGPQAMNSPTNSAGCAIFSRIPVGTYTATVNQSGWVGPSGVQATSTTQDVTTGNLNVATITYDQASTVRVTFDTQLNGATAITSRGWGATAENSSPSVLTRVTSGSSLAASFDLLSMFPTSAGTKVWAGNCAAANPVSAIPNANYFSGTPGSAAAPVLVPNQVNNVTVRLPALNLTVAGLGTGATKANVVLKSTTSSGCAGPTKIVMRADASSVLRATKTWVTGSTIDPGVPFGTYQVCVDNGGTSITAANRRRIVLTTNVAVTDPVNGGGPMVSGVVQPVNLTSGGPAGTRTTSTNAYCNLTETSSTFPGP